MAIINQAGRAIKYIRNGGDDSFRQRRARFISESKFIANPLGPLRSSSLRKLSLASFHRGGTVTLAKNPRIIIRSTVIPGWNAAVQ